MKRQLSPLQCETIAQEVSKNEGQAPLLEELKSTFRMISMFYPEFTMRDFSGVWGICKPQFVWDAEKNKTFYSLLKKTPQKGFWIFSPAQVEEAPVQVEEAPAQVEEAPAQVEEAPAQVVGEPKVEEAPVQVVESLTRQFLIEEIKKGSHNRVAGNIKKKFPQIPWEELTSEVKALFLEWGQKGTCDKFLLNGKPPSIAILSVWAAQKIHQRIYGDATDALNREFLGLRTQTEIRKRKEKSMEDLILEEGLKADPHALKTVWVLHEDDSRELVVVSPEVEFEEDLLEENKAKLSLIRSYIQIKRKRSPERFTRVFDFIKKGTPKAEAAAIEGCSELTISHLYQKVKDDIREAPKVLNVALLLLKKIAEEPYSTFEELQEENPSLEEKKLSQALQVLLAGDLISEAKGKSFFPTEEGKLLGENS